MLVCGTGILLGLDEFAGRDGSADLGQTANLRCERRSKKRGGSTAGGFDAGLLDICGSVHLSSTYNADPSRGCLEL